MNGEAGYHRAIAREIGGNAKVEDVRGGSVLRLTCTGGKATEPHLAEYPMNGHFPPERLNRLMTQRGWRVGKRVTCPDCMEKERNMATASPAPQPEPSTPTPSDAAKRATRMIFMALEDYYDDGKRAYKPGHSDKSIAAEFDVSEVYVAKVRDDHFGPLAEPEAVAAFRAELDTVRRQADKLESDAKAVATGIRTTVDELSAKLDRIVKTNGWRS